MKLPCRVVLRQLLAASPCTAGLWRAGRRRDTDPEHGRVSPPAAVRGAASSDRGLCRVRVLLLPEREEEPRCQVPSPSRVSLALLRRVNESSVSPFTEGPRSLPKARGLFRFPGCHSSHTKAIQTRKEITAVCSINLISFLYQQAFILLWSKRAVFI